MNCSVQSIRFRKMLGIFWLCHPINLRRTHIGFGYDKITRNAYAAYWINFLFTKQIVSELS